MKYQEKRNDSLIDRSGLGGTRLDDSIRIDGPVDMGECLLEPGGPLIDELTPENPWVYLKDYRIGPITKISNSDG